MTTNKINMAPSFYPTPFVIAVDDYHEFSFIEDLYKLLSKNFRVVELGRFDSNYIGLVYFGEKPSKKIIDEILVKENINLED